MNDLPLLAAAIGFLLCALIILYVYCNFKPKRVAPPQPKVVVVHAQPMEHSAPIDTKQKSESVLSDCSTVVQTADESLNNQGSDTSNSRAAQLRAAYYRISQAFDADAVVSDELYPVDQDTHIVDIIVPVDKLNDVSDKYGLHDTAPSIYSTLRKTLSLYRPKSALKQTVIA